MAIFFILWGLGALFNVSLWVLALWDKPEYTLGDVYIGVCFLLFSWLGWVILAASVLCEYLDSITIYRKK